MSKLKTISREEDLEKIAPDEPVLVDLGPINSDPKKTDNRDADQLRNQLATMQDSAKREAEERNRLLRENAELKRRTEEASARASESELITFKNSLASAQAARDAAKIELLNAHNNADYEAVVTAQSKLSRAEAEILNCEAVLAEADDRAKTVEKHEHQQPRTVNDVLSDIDANPNLSAKEKSWIREHPEFLTDPVRNQELVTGHARAIRKGLARGSDAYFEYLDEFMGINQDNRDDEVRDVQAPVSRNATDLSGRRTNSRVELTASERELAKSLGVTDIEYAQQKLKMQQDKQINPERYGRNG